MSELVFDLSPTQYAFVTCNHHIVQVLGPMGEGKTVAGIAACYAHADRCGTMIRAALLRDTFQNIKTSTIPDMREILGQYVKFSDGKKKATFFAQPNTPCVELDLFGIDSEGALSKLQGPQYALIWLEEPAPIVEKANAGLPKSVFDLAVARAARQRGTVLRVQVTQNPSDEEHWTSDLEYAPEVYAEYKDPDTGEVFQILKKCFNILPGENKYLSGLTRAANIAAFQGDEAKYTRYVKGLKAAVQKGKKVTPAYKEEIHFSEEELPVIAGQQLIQMWDAWHHPSCILAQYTHDGQLVVHDVFAGEGLGSEDLIEEQIEPKLLSTKYAGKITSMRIIGDPSMTTPDQSSVRRITSKIVANKFKKYGRPRFEKGPVRWPARRDPVNQCFKRLMNDGRPAITVSRSAFLLNRALKGGWHYKTDNNGRIIGEKPMQNAHDHIGQSFAYGIAILMPYNPKDEYQKKVMAAVRAANQKRAMAYQPGSFRRTIG